MNARGLCGSVGWILALALGACGGASNQRASNGSAPASSGDSTDRASTTSSSTVASGSPMPGADGTPIGEAPPDFPHPEPEHWVNGAPMMLASAHGDVVLVESWHRL